MGERRGKGGGGEEGRKGRVHVGWGGEEGGSAEEGRECGREG